MNKLFEAFSIGSLRAKNRFVRAATYEALADADGRPTPALQAVYEELAEGGAGLIITGYAHVVADEQPNPHMLGMHDDALVPAYRELVDAVHERGARIVAQIVYGGSATRLDPPSARILGPSAVAEPDTGIVPIEASERDIRELTEAFAQAARRAQASGFDGVELHAAHGYLLSQFLSPLMNRRTDAYGGSIENRARIVCEIVEAVRRATAPSFPLLVKLNSSDGAEGGLTEEDSLAAAKLFVRSGADAIEASGVWRACKTRDFDGEPFFGVYARKLAGEVDVPVILTGGNRRFDVMERMAAEDGIAAFGLSRPLLCEPGLVNRWKADPSAPVRCVSCNQCIASPDRRCILRKRDEEAKG